MNHFRNHLRTFVIACIACALLGLMVLTFRTHDFSLSAAGEEPRGLEFLWIQTAYDPILALPGSEPDALSEVVSALRDSEAATLEAYTDAEQERIATSLQPYDFLETLPDLERARRVFIDTPSYWHAVRYHIALMRALVLLGDYTGRLSDDIYDLEFPHYMSTPGGNTSRLFVAQTLAGAYVRAQEQQTEVLRRIRCLVVRRDCVIRYPLIQAAPTENDAIDHKSTLGYANALRSYFISSPASRIRTITSASPESLPLVYVRNTACTLRNSSAYLLSWRGSRVSDITTLLATPVDEIYFHRTADNASLFEGALADAGVAYAYQQMNPYFCFDYTLDAGRVRAAYAVYDALSDDPIAAVYSEEALHELRTHEHAIVSENLIIDTAAIEAYMHAAATLLYNDASKRVLTEQDQRRLLALLTLWRAKSPWLETEIATMEDMSITNRYVFRIMDIPLSVLFFTRSYYSTLLLSGNETLYRTPLSFTEYRPDILPPGSDLVPYQGVLEQSVPLSELSAFMLLEGQKSSRVYTVE